jgi:hypothetical protein
MPVFHPVIQHATAVIAGASYKSQSAGHAPPAPVIFATLGAAIIIGAGL